MENKASVGYDCYKSVVKDNDALRDELKQLKKELEENKADHTMDKARVVYAYHILNAGRDEHVLMHQDDKAREVTFWKMKYDKVFMEMEHYKKLAETLETKYVREKAEWVEDTDNLEKTNDDYYCQLLSYQKHNKVLKQKYDSLFEKHKITLEVIEELERNIDQCLDCRSGIKRCCK